MAEGKVMETPQASTREDGKLSRLSWIGLGLSLAAAYGTFAAFLARFLYPSGPPSKGWMFVCPMDELATGNTLRYQTPSGALVNITRKSDQASAQGIVALSSTCPHLGCQVHWEGHNNRYFCPCHSGVFGPDGEAIEGPPAQAGQRLEQYPLKDDKGLLYIQVSVAEAALGPGKVLPGSPHPQGPGHDPCLAACALPSASRWTSHHSIDGA